MCKLNWDKICGFFLRGKGYNLYIYWFKDKIFYKSRFKGRKCSFDYKKNFVYKS